MKDERTILHADMDAFFARVEKLDRPELEDEPVIVGGLGERGVVSTACYVARRDGVHSAMPMEEARRRCPDATFLAPRGERYREVAGTVREVFRSFTPEVQSVSLDEAYLDVTGILHQYGSPTQLGQMLRERVREATRLSCSVGIGPNKMVAKLASDQCKPDGLRVVDRGNVRGFLADLSVGAVPGIGPETQQTFQAAGYQTLGDVQEASLDELYETFGDRALVYRRRAHGRHDAPVVTDDSAQSISHERTFEEDLEARDRLEDHLFQLCEKVGRRLRGEEHEARTVQLKVRRGDFTTLNRQVTRSRPFGSTERIWRLARELFRERVELDARGVRLLGVGVGNLQPLDLQGDLFNDQKPRRFERADRVMDRINDELGPGTLGRARDLDDGEELDDTSEAS